jgi:very-short-patch-repair endonuclease
MILGRSLYFHEIRGGVNINFEQAHQRFFQSHLDRRAGERKGRLERGHRHGEKLFLQNIWWLLKGNFDGLHPEYEVVDWRGKSYFGDFAYMPRSDLKFIFEIKGYNKHVKEMDRQGFGNECKRELFLEGLGFHVISFAYDDVEQQPELLIALLRMLLSRYESIPMTSEAFSFAENEVIRLALSMSLSVRPKDVTSQLRMNYRRAVGHLQSLSDRGWFRPVRGDAGRRIVRYELVRSIFM